MVSIENPDNKNDGWKKRGMTGIQPYLSKRVAGLAGSFQYQRTGCKAISGKVIESKELVPEGHIWVLGDNEARSRDSRLFGPVPLSDVKGKVVWRWGANGSNKVYHGNPKRGLSFVEPSPSPSSRPEQEAKPQFERSIDIVSKPTASPTRKDRLRAQGKHPK
jgi:hypothetical protein